MKFLLLSLVCASVAGCAELRELRNPPELTPVRAELSAHAFAPAAANASDRGTTFNPRKPNLFANGIALQPGDILTISISIDDRAKLQNRSDRTRNVSRSLAANAALDIEGASGAGSGSANVISGTSYDGEGGTVRSESVRLSIAAVVVERLPNGNLVVDGQQEVRVNDEMRVLRIEGIVRQSDIGPTNVVSYERIAEARISYGGRGPVAEVQRPPYGQRLLDHILPF